MNKKCSEKQILNPATGRCVKRDGRIGKMILQLETKALLKIHIMKDMYVIFEPELTDVWTSSLEHSKSPTKKNYQIWNKVGLQQYLKWYKQFESEIKKVFKEYSAEFVSFNVHSKKKLVLNIQVPIDFIIKDVQTSPLINAVAFTLSPDKYEKHIVKFNDRFYTVHSSSMKIKK